MPSSLVRRCIVAARSAVPPPAMRHPPDPAAATAFDPAADAEGLDPPGLAWFADLSVEVGAPIEIGRMAHGLRRVIPIAGGACVGRGFEARVLPGGADFQLVATPTMARLEARYVLETDAGERLVGVYWSIALHSALGPRLASLRHDWNAARALGRFPFSW